MSRRFSALTASLRAMAESRRKWRIPLLLAGLAVFVIGCVISIRNLGIEPSEISYAHLAILLLIWVPVGLVYAALNMLLTAKATLVEMPFRDCLRIACFAQTAEVLPLPGGAIVRTAALVQRGASTKFSASQVLANAILWIGCAAAAAGVSMWELGWPSLALALVGFIAVAASLSWVAWNAGLLIACASLALRLVGLGLIAGRLFTSFAVLGFAAGLGPSLLFAFASIAGSASSIAPAGLGISEALAALLAGSIAVPPAVAFLAVGLNRIAGITLSGIASGLFLLFGQSGEIR